MRAGFVGALVFVCAADAGCNGERNMGGPGSNTRPDLSLVFVEEQPDLLMEQMLNECGDTNPTCTVIKIGPPDSPFPLGSDPKPDPSEKDVGIKRDPNGWLGLDQVHAGFDKMWIANSSDNGAAGTVSKVDATGVREAARYATVTCYSLKTGSTDACDGQNGCCSLDDWARYQARKNKQPEPGHQAVQRTQNNPSRTAVDFNGDLFISNRAFGGQSSVTRISANTAGCIDRNKNGRIDTSSDVNQNGFIETDCNENGKYDDLADVQGTPCTNGLKQEYYGVDDECILWTTNTLVANAVGRPLALAGVDANNPFGSSVVAWAGSYNNANFVRIDGNSGRCDADVQLDKQCRPYGAAVDGSGVLWATTLGGGKLCYLDTRKPSDANTGMARDPQWGAASGYGITMDRDQNVWIGSGVARYEPDRSNGFMNLGNGIWTRIGNLSGSGIAADSRNAKEFFVWSCGGGKVTRIAPSEIPKMKVDQTFNNLGGWPTINMPCYGVGVDAKQNVWGIDMATSTRALVDNMGNITQPVVKGMPAGNNKCPAGDSCPNAGAYTYSDFTGFGLRNFTAPRGYYSMIHHGMCPPTWEVRWLRVEWEFDAPPNTSLAAKARSGKTPVPDMNWSGWTLPAPMGPLDLTMLPRDSEYMELWFDFATMDVVKSPKLKWIKVYYECFSEG